MDRRFRQGALGTRYVAPKPYVPPVVNRAAPRRKPYVPPLPPKQIIAEVDDDFESLSKKLGIDTQDLVKANIDNTTIKAGAVYNVPTPTVDPNIGFDVPRALPGETIQEFTERVNPQLTQEEEKLNIFKDIFFSGGGSPGRLPGETISDFLKPVRDFFSPDNETSLLPSGKPLASPIIPPPPLPESKYGIGGQGATLRDLVWAEGMMEGRQPLSAPSKYGVGGQGATLRDLVWAADRQPPVPEYADFRKAEVEAGARDAYIEREARFLSGEFGVTGKPEYELAPGPQVGFDFQLEGSQSDLYKALSEQTRAIYNTEPALRMEKYGMGLIGLNLYEEQGMLDVVGELGFEPWVKPFTVNFLNQFPGTNVSINEAGELTGDIDWSYIDDETIRRLEDLGFIAAGQAVGGGVVGGGGVGSTGTSRYRSSGYAPRGDQLYSRGSQLALTSWSI